VCCFLFGHISYSQISPAPKVMDGIPPSRESLVTPQNYREYPFSQWSFRNFSGIMRTAMIPREGPVHVFKEKKDASIASLPVAGHDGSTDTFESVFEKNEVDGLIVVRDGKIRYERYWNGLTRHSPHIWFSVTKSLTSTAFGVLVSAHRVDLTASPAVYVRELRGTPWERTTLQQVLNMSTALGFVESYTDTSSVFYKYYGDASGFFPDPTADADPRTARVLGTYDFLTRIATPNENLQPGLKFEYSSANVDVISWVISRVTGNHPFHQFVQETIWSRLGAEHDAYIMTDRLHTAMATGGMNSTLRDAALFGLLVLNRGQIDGKQLISPDWVDAPLKVTAEDKERYRRNEIYPKAGLPWVAYKNFWWILDEKRGEYAGVGIHGQVLYLNRAAGLVIAYFSSQPVASSAASKNFQPKLTACHALGQALKP
jgi:CubicO group peptidase (beta-lactamase class C family)